MEHELLKMPETKQEAESTKSVCSKQESVETKAIRRPAWDGTFWGHSNSVKRRTLTQLIEEAKQQGLQLPLRSSSDQPIGLEGDKNEANLPERRYDRPWRQDSMSRKRSWHQKLKDKLQNRLQVLKEEQTATITNNNNEADNESTSQQVNAT